MCLRCEVQLPYGIWTGGMRILTSVGSAHNPAMKLFLISVLYRFFHCKVSDAFFLKPLIIVRKNLKQHLLPRRVSRGHILTVICANTGNLANSIIIIQSSHISPVM